MEVKIKITPTILKDKLIGVNYELNGKLFTHEEISKALFNMGISALVKWFKNNV